MKLLLFEFKKMIRTKTVLYFFMLSAIFVAAIFIRNVVQQDMIPLKKAEYFWDFRTDVTMQNHTDRQTLEKFDDSELEEKLAVGQHLSSLLGELIQAIEDGEWEKELTLEIDVYETAMEYQALKGQFLLGQLDMEDAIQINEALQKVSLAKEDADLSVQQAVFMKKMYSFLFGPLGFLLFIFVTGSSITREFEENNTKFIYTLPIPRWKYIVIKLGSIFVIGFLWLSIITSISYVLPLFVQQPDGNVFDYPLLTAGEKIIPIRHYLMNATVLTIGFLLFAISLLVLLSYLFRNTIFTYVALFILFISGWMMAINGFINVVNPFSYQLVDQVLMNNPQHFPIGLAILGLSSVVFLWLTISGNRKRGV